MWLRCICTFVGLAFSFITIRLLRFYIFVKIDDSIATASLHKEVNTSADSMSQVSHKVNVGPTTNKVTEALLSPKQITPLARERHFAFGGIDYSGS